MPTTPLRLCKEGGRTTRWESPGWQLNDPMENRASRESRRLTSGMLSKRRTISTLFGPMNCWVILFLKFSLYCKGYFIKSKVPSSVGCLSTFMSHKERKKCCQLSHDKPSIVRYSLISKTLNCGGKIHIKTRKYHNTLTLSWVLFPNYPI